MSVLQCTLHLLCQAFVYSITSLETTSSLAGMVQRTLAIESSALDTSSFPIDILHATFALRELFVFADLVSFLWEQERTLKALRWLEPSSPALVPPPQERFLLRRHIGFQRIGSANYRTHSSTASTTPSCSAQPSPLWVSSPPLYVGTKTRKRLNPMPGVMQQYLSSSAGSTSRAEKRVGSW